MPNSAAQASPGCLVLILGGRGEVSRAAAPAGWAVEQQEEAEHNKGRRRAAEREARGEQGGLANRENAWTLVVYRGRRRAARSQAAVAGKWCSKIEERTCMMRKVSRLRTSWRSRRGGCRLNTHSEDMQAVSHPALLYVMSNHVALKNTFSLDVMAVQIACYKLVMDRSTGIRPA